MKHLHQLEYVCSAISMFSGTSQNKKCIELAIPELIKDTDHQFSVLYNGYTEQKLGKVIRELYGDSINSIHVDSGGLQVMTLGKTNSPELRDAVYTNQAEWGDVGMCFDEIPIQNDAHGKMAKILHDSKTLITGKMFESGKKTGQNVKRQIEIYEQLGTKCTPQLILQGNAPIDFKNFYEGAVEGLGKENLIKLRGIAIAGASLGTGVLESCDMLSMMQFLDLPEHLTLNIHLLGFGSIKRLLPAIILLKSGYLKNNIHISYDSSRHSNAPIFGNAPKLNSETFGQYGIGQYANPKMRQSAQDIYSIFHKSILNLFKDEEHWIDTYVKCYSGEIKNARDIDPMPEGPAKTLLLEQYQLTRLLLSYINIYSFIRHLEKAYEDPIKSCQSYGISALSGLNNVTNYDEYLKWRASAYSSLKGKGRISRDVERVQKHNITSFFN